MLNPLDISSFSPSVRSIIFRTPGLPRLFLRREYAAQRLAEIACDFVLRPVHDSVGFTQDYLPQARPPIVLVVDFALATNLERIVL